MYLAHAVVRIVNGSIGLLLVGIVLIYRSLDWFIGEYGTGGSEYNVVLIVNLLIVAAAENAFGCVDTNLPAACQVAH